MENLEGKKILFLITKSNLGGAQKYVYELACAAKGVGGIVTVAMGGTGGKNAEIGPLADKLTSQGVSVVIIKNFMRNVSFVQDIKACIEITKLIHTQRPDVLHVTSSKAGGFGALAGRLNRVKTIIFTSHGLTFDESWRPTHQRMAIKLLTWGTLLLAHKSIMISKDTYHKARNLPFIKDKIHLIYNGVRTQLLVTKKDTQKILVLEADKPNTLWIGGIGELHPNKNWMLLIEAMATLPKHILCIIIGEGEQRPLLEKRITELGLQERVILKGFIPDASLLLPAYDIFILPSYKEGLPYVLLEAGLAQCTVACSNISGNTDIIHNDVNGLLFEHTTENLVTAITKLSKDKILRKDLSQALHTDVATKFSMDKMLTETFNIYKT